MQTNLYESDFYAWTIEQTELLQRRKLDHLDFDNLIEEITSLGKQQQQELRNRLGLLIGHLLKWQYQSEKRTRSWQVTIQLQRQEIYDLLQDNPSLKSYLDKALLQGFRLGLAQVLSETPISKKVLPDVCPYSLTELLDSNFPDDIGIEF
ncbi:protein of unknown function DUF29 [Synechococcus sp. PCC 7502]|uniref:DUF29 domain-containing protein n=1 Tax=Synechococcus sp. PCC 7502 TaxID=1173263 RepID=UPI00029FCDB8|nr:DUF29 domain-containing protein [Synechococcus sp. PCC 7502]AFY72857.1 protein of unknown function DUF29 [Synechococcus sp. PCC 7502]